MSASVFLLCGPVASGKTQALLDRYRERAADGIGTALWLAPTERTRDALRPRLPGPSGVCLAPNLYTFPDFARQVVRAAEPLARPLPELHQRLLLDDILADLFRRGELAHFAAAADHRGFADAVFGLLTELKGQGVGPEEFARTAAQLAGVPACGSPDGAGRLRAKDRQIAFIYA